MIGYALEHTQEWTPPFDGWPARSELPVRQANQPPRALRYVRAARQFRVRLEFVALLASTFAVGFAGAALVNAADAEFAGVAPHGSRGSSARSGSLQAVPFVVGKHVNVALLRLSRLGHRTTLQFRPTTRATGTVVAQRLVGESSSAPHLLLVVDVGTVRPDAASVRRTRENAG